VALQNNIIPLHKPRYRNSYTFKFGSFLHMWAGSDQTVGSWSHTGTGAEQSSGKIKEDGGGEAM